MPNRGKITYGELKDHAQYTPGVDPEDSYEELREQIDINTCRHCGGEYVTGWSDKFCSDGCQVQYIHEADHL